MNGPVVPSFSTQTGDPLSVTHTHPAEQLFGSLHVRHAPMRQIPESQVASPLHLPELPQAPGVAPCPSNLPFFFLGTDIVFPFSQKVTFLPFFPLTAPSRRPSSPSVLPATRPRMERLPLGLWSARVMESKRAPSME